MKKLPFGLPASRAFFGLAGVLLLASCGGGSSSGVISPPVSTAPKFVSSGSVSVVENTSGVFYTASATDPQSDPVTLSLYSGPDADKFVLEANGGLRFNTPPNYDLPIDAGGDNVYNVTLRATAGGEHTDLALKVTVTNDREGVSVSRVATGFVDPVAINNIPNKATLLVAEAGGRVLRFDEASKTFSEDTFIRDHKHPGRILAIAYGFGGNSFQEGVYLLTYSATEGLYIQAFNSGLNKTGFFKLGDPGEDPGAASMLTSGSIYLAIGDPDGVHSQDSSSPMGKLYQLPAIDPYAGASLPPTDIVNIRPKMIGDGIQKPGGLSPEYGRLYLADQGSSIYNEVTIFQPDAVPLDFGWPFYEGATALRPNAPAAVNGPTIVYGFGDGKKEGTGVIAGLINDYNFLPALGHNYVFADKNGTIWTISYSKLIDGYLHNSSELEDRTEDFEPDVGKIDSPVAVVAGAGSDHFYILDNDGELFRVGQAS